MGTLCCACDRNKTVMSLVHEHEIERLSWENVYCFQIISQLHKFGLRCNFLIFSLEFI